MKSLLFIVAALLLGLIGILGIYLRFFAVLVSIGVEGGRVLIRNRRRLEERELLGHPSYDH